MERIEPPLTFREKDYECGVTPFYEVFCLNGFGYILLAQLRNAVFMDAVK